MAELTEIVITPNMIEERMIAGAKALLGFLPDTKLGRLVVQSARRSLGEHGFHAESLVTKGATN